MNTFVDSHTISYFLVYFVATKWVEPSLFLRSLRVILPHSEDPAGVIADNVPYPDTHLSQEIQYRRILDKDGGYVFGLDNGNVHYDNRLS